MSSTDWGLPRPVWTSPTGQTSGEEPEEKRGIGVPKEQGELHRKGVRQGDY